MRTVAIYKNAVAVPGFCAKCGSQQRDWFLDLGFDVEGKTTPPPEMGGSVPFTWFEGNLYLCCECFNGLMQDFVRFWPQFASTHEINVQPWMVSQNVDGSYESSVGSHFDSSITTESVNPASESDDHKSEHPQSEAYEHVGSISGNFEPFWS